jgi:hypothetical protein
LWRTSESTVGKVQKPLPSALLMDLPPSSLTCPEDELNSSGTLYVSARMACSF